MVDVSKLRGKIAEKGLQFKEVSEQLNIDYSTLNRRLNRGGTTFTIEEAIKLTDMLGLSKEEAVSIFFTKYVA